MENYVKGAVKEIDDEPVFQDVLVDGVIHMNVKGGSKIRNLIGFAVKKMQEPTTIQMTWSGSGSDAVTKVITCAEIIKRKFKNLHQLNDIRFKRIEELWEPKIDDLDQLKVKRDIPQITILLSKEPLNADLLGYQGPGKLEDKPTAVQPRKASGSSTMSSSNSRVSAKPSLKRKRKPKSKQRNGENKDG